MNGLDLIYVGLGGAAGAISRFMVSIFFNRYQSIFPFGTFTVNILGCFLLGLIYALTLNKSFIFREVNLMISIGFLGAFTTFSTFSMETISIINQSKPSLALLYLGLSLIFGLIAICVGSYIGNLF